MSHEYADIETFKARVGITKTGTDPAAQSALTAASRAVEKYCNGRRFWQDAAVVARTFTPNHLLTLNVGDISTTTGLIVQTDEAGDGTFETTWATTDYQLLPVDAAYAYSDPRPWTALRAVGGRTFPWLINTWLTRLDRVKITAKWGFPAVPPEVVEATLIKATRIYMRKDSPQGVAGFGDFGVVRITRTQDPDVADLLSDLRKFPVLVG